MKSKPTAKELHDYCQQLGVTAKTAGKPLNLLIEDAHASEDPKAFLDLYAPAGGNGQHQQTASEPVVPEVAISDIPKALVEFPYVPEIPAGVYVPDSLHLEVQLRKPATSRAFKRLSMALLQKGEKLANGRPVFSSANVVEWIVEQIAAAMEA